MLRFLLPLIIILQSILLYRESATTPLYALTGPNYFNIIIALTGLLSCSSYYFYKSRHLLLVLCGFLFLPFLGATTAHLCCYILLLPMTMGTLDKGYLNYFKCLGLSLFLSLIISTQIEIFAVAHTIKNSNVNWFGILDIVKMAKFPIMNFLDFLIIGSVPFYLDEDNRKKLLTMILKITPVYVVLSAIFIYLQHLGFPYFSLNQSAFWSYANRFSGIASDPNAQGLILGILVMLVIFEKKYTDKLYLPLILSIVGLSQFSGSRTFYMFFVPSVLIALASSKRNIVSRKNLLLYCLPISLCILNIGIYLKDYFAEQSSIRRFLDTIDPNTFTKMLESRTTFLKIAYEGMKEKPFLGYGLKGFYEVQSYLAQMAGIDLGNWRDNSNNFYTELILTFGLPIAIYFIWFILRNVFKFRKYDRNVLIYLAVSAVALLSGPHIYFLEFYFLLIILLAPIFLTKVCTQAGNTKLLIVVLISILGSFYYDSNQSLGFYPIESDMTRWSIGYSKVILCEEKESNPKSKFLVLKNHHPSKHISFRLDPISHAKMHRNPSAVQNGIIPPGEIRSIPIKTDSMLYSNNLWSPAKELNSRDNRNITLQLEWHSSFKNCL